MDKLKTVWEWVVWLHDEAAALIGGYPRVAMWTFFVLLGLALVF